MHRLGAFRTLPRYQQGNLQRRGFFLNASRIGDDQAALLHQRDKLGVTHRRCEFNARIAFEYRTDHWTSVGIRMGYENETVIVETLGQF